MTATTQPTTTLPRRTVWSLLGIVIGFFLLVYLLRAVLLPFAIAGIIAYLLHPTTTRLTAQGIPRSGATLIALLASFLVIIGIGLLFVPIISAQVVSFKAMLPQYIEQFTAQLAPLLQHAQKYIDGKSLGDLPEVAKNQGGQVVAFVGDILKTLLSSGGALLSVVPLLFLTPVIAFYWLRDWQTMLDVIDSLWPRSLHTTISGLLAEMNQCVAGFLRGQLLVALVLGVFYAAALSLAGLEFGFLIGMLSGLLTFVPYVGTLLGGLASIGIAFGQFGLSEWPMVALIAGIYVVGQFLEGNVLVPKLVGDQVGLHPVWIFFALLTAGASFGFLGVLLAVPMAAALGVLVRFGVERYRRSALYA
ncbi:MAG: AI-2E family transporter [Holosporales bacterium]